MDDVSWLEKNYGCDHITKIYGVENMNTGDKIYFKTKKRRDRFYNKLKTLDIVSIDKIWGVIY